MRAEFKVNLKQTRSQHVTRNKNKLRTEPMLRQYLVLAYQLKKTIEPQRGRTLKEISGWLGYTPSRISQIMGLLFLSPFIQEEILLSSEPYLHKITINEANLMAQEILWDKQKMLWLQTRDKER